MAGSWVAAGGILLPGCEEGILEAFGNISGRLADSFLVVAQPQESRQLTFFDKPWICLDLLAMM